MTDVVASQPQLAADPAEGQASVKRRPTAADGDMPLEELIAHHLRAQTRLRGVVEEVAYTDEAQGLGSGSIRCMELDQLVPFSCRNVSLEKGVIRIAHAGDPCTMKLSCRGQEVRATSIRIKARRQAPAAGTAEGGGSEAAAAAGQPSPAKLRGMGSDPVAVPVSTTRAMQHDPVGPSPPGRSPNQAGQEPAAAPGSADGSGAGEGNSGTHELFKGDSPLNAFEYAAAAAAAPGPAHSGMMGTGASATGSSYGLSPHPAGPPQWPGSLPWSAMEPVTPGHSLQQQPGASMPMPPQLPQSLQQGN